MHNDQNNQKNNQIDQFLHKFCLKKNPFLIIYLQNSIVKKCLFKINKTRLIPKQIISIISLFIFHSPFSFQEQCFQLLQGSLHFHLKSAQDQKYFFARNQFTLKQNYCYILGSKNYVNQRIKIKKIWKKPKTRTQNKLLSFKNQFLDFISGKYLLQNQQKKMKRIFVVNQDEQNDFKQKIRNILQTNQNYNPYTFDIFFELVSKNYIQIQIIFSQITNQKKMYFIAEGNNKKEIINGISCDINNERWKFEGNFLNIWGICPNKLKRNCSIIKLRNYKNVYCQNTQIEQIILFQ